MYLTHLSLTNFRNFARMDVEVPRGQLMLVGDNAQGKTSLLEAIYFLATFISFNTSNERELINMLAKREPLAGARIQAAFCRQQGEGSYAQMKTHQLEVKLILDDSQGNGSIRLRKDVKLDGVKRKISEVIGQFNAVLFLPQMLRIVEGSPEERRRYLNLAMAQALPHFAEILADYNQILSQRNALLKLLNERRSDPATVGGQLVFWDEKLARKGAEIMSARIQTIRDLERLAIQVHSQLTHGDEVLRMIYKPSFEPLPKRPGQFTMKLDAAVDRSGLALEKIYTAFMEQLERSRAEEITRGITTIGPHRDEVRFLANQIDLGTYGSRGQARTVVLSLKLAEVGWMKEKTGEWPVLLLDEVLAELDPNRRFDLLDRLRATEQAIMTTTDLELFTEAFIKASCTWRVRAGQIIVEASDED